jgi:hypothetical protein
MVGRTAEAGMILSGSKTLGTTVGSMPNTSKFTGMRFETVVITRKKGWEGSISRFVWSTWVEGIHESETFQAGVNMAETVAALRCPKNFCIDHWEPSFSTMSKPRNYRAGNEGQEVRTDVPSRQLCNHKYVRQMSFFTRDSILMP